MMAVNCIEWKEEVLNKTGDLFSNSCFGSDLKLIGTDFHFSNDNWFGQKPYWWTYVGPYPMHISFEHVLDNVHEHIQTQLLFHLDLFT